MGPTLNLRRRIRGILPAAVVALLLAAPATASCTKDYEYAGLVRRTAAAGVQADLTPLANPTVAWGHVAAWVGVSGANSWLQVGLNGVGSGANVLYYEVTRPGSSPQYTQLVGSVAVGETHRVGVLEMAGHPGWWRVWLDDKDVSGPLHLLGSFGHWQPMAMAESWNGGHAVCNSFRYGFGQVQIAQALGGSWTQLTDGYPLVDTGFRLLRTGAGGFIATTTG
jgi:hypothetical protein